MERLLAKHGYVAVTTNHVADTAGVGIGSVYEYFGDKDAIVAEVARRTITRILDDIASARSDVMPIDPEAALRAWIHTMFVAVRSRSDIVRVLWREVPFLWELEELRALPDRMLVIARAARREPSPTLDESQLEAATYLLTVMVSQAVITSTIEPPSHLSPEAIETTLTTMLATLLLTPPPARS
ncbi:MAG: TetR/AcrR family transcriptional regulator [Deltaproteobacteria bacterium]|nr:TetR/AcrR family transcriptional regulator [Deltaproteobacteria bacterium]